MDCNLARSMAVFRHYIIRFITLVVALQLLNLSIYAQEFTPLPPPCNTTAPEVNIDETIIEYVLENILNHKNAIPEQEDTGSRDLQFHKHVSFKAIDFKPYCLPELPPAKPLAVTMSNESYDYLFLREINPPPPKA